MNKKKIIIICILIVITIGAVVGGIVYYQYQKKVMINVVGMNYDEAKKKIEKTKDIEIYREYDGGDEAYSHDKDEIFYQSVKAGERTDKVKVHVGKGIAYKMPKLKGKKYASLDAKTKDTLSKIDKVVVLYCYGQVEQGRIIETSNDYDSRVFKDELLKITVCKKKVPYPDSDLIGKNWGKVKKYYKGADINVKKEFDSSKAGTILDFSQLAVEKGKKVKIDVSISDGKAIDVPDVTGMTEAKAKRKLDKKGIKYKTKYVYKDMYSDSYKPKNRVKSQSDEGLVQKGKVIKLTIKRPAIRITSMRTEVNSVGGIFTNMKFTNISNKTINYIKFRMRYYNRVGDPIEDDIKGGNEIYLNFTGPLAPHASTEQERDNCMYDSSTGAVAPYSAIITFKNGKKQTLTFMKKYHRYWYWHNDAFATDDINDPDLED